MKNSAAAIACLSLLLAAGLLYADDTSFRCGGDLIDVGYTMYQVKDSCGAPDSEQIVGSAEVPGSGYSIATPRKIPGRNRVVVPDTPEVTMKVTEWVYNKDHGIYILTFVGSKLVKKEFRRLN